jgi:hypothetical protein
MSQEKESVETEGPQQRDPTGQQPEESFTLTPEQRRFLRESIEQARRGEGIDGWELLEELRSEK